MNHKEIRETFFSFFENRGHFNVLSAPLVPAKDPTLLFTNAGMNQFKGVFLGEEKRNYDKAVSIQKCMRVSGKHNDFNEVGKTEFHHTFFEMMGNFSFGDYFKEKAIAYGWELLTEHYGFDSKDLWITIHHSDDEAFRIWEKEIGIPVEKIVRLGDKDNFWQMGDTGPCGPCSEIHFDKGDAFGIADFEKNENRFVEIWNLVFMQYFKDTQGTLNPLPSPSIDTGMGLERLSSLLQKKSSNYETDIFEPIIRFSADLAGVQSRKRETDISLKVIADHIRALTFLISDGVVPANDGRGYVLRRLLRRASRHGRKLGLDAPFLYKVSDVVVSMMEDEYPDLFHSKAFISEMILSEEERFGRTLLNGLKRFEDILTEVTENGERMIPGDDLFRLSDTYGFPIDFAFDLASERDIAVDEAGYGRALEDQKHKSRTDHAKRRKQVIKLEGIDRLSTEFVGYTQNEGTGVIIGMYKKEQDQYIPIENENGGGGVEIVLITDRTPFYAESGGQVGDIGFGETHSAFFEVKDTRKVESGAYLHYINIEKGEIKKGEQVFLKVDANHRRGSEAHHTATHLLHSALREVLGLHVKQAGSFVGPKRLRFDFTHYKGLSEAEINAVESLVNRKIMDNMSVSAEEKSYEAAIRDGAIAIFDEKYSDIVRNVRVDKFSSELCGGTHLKRTGDAGLFKVVSESSISSGIRRIEAVTGEAAIEYVNQKLDILDRLQHTFKQKPDQLLPFFSNMSDKLKEKSKSVKSDSPVIDIKSIVKSAAERSGTGIVVEFLDGLDRKQLSTLADKIANETKGVAILFSHSGDKSVMIVSVHREATSSWNANELVKKIGPLFNGKGGGRADFAQAGGEPIAQFANLRTQILALMEN